MTENYGIEGWNSPSIFFSFSCRINNGGARGRSIIFGFMCAYFRGVVLIKYVFFEYNP